MESVPWVLISTAAKISFADAWQSTTPGVLREGEGKGKKVYVINKKIVLLRVWMHRWRVLVRLEQVSCDSTKFGRA